MQHLDRAWARFRGWPWWVQSLIWIALGPLLAAFLVVRGDPESTTRRAVAGGVLVAGALVWAMALPRASQPASDAISAPGSDGSDDATTAGSPAATTAPAVPTPEETTAPPASSPSPAAEPVPSPTPTPLAVVWTVTHIVDGDTLDVRSTDGVVERIRIVGIDTPERGECGYQDASDALAAMLRDRHVTLTAATGDDRDRYDRLLRYVDVDGLDAGHALVGAGLAIARYDSRDGYGPHPREALYVAADAASVDVSCPVATTPPAPPPPAVVAQPEPEPEPKPEAPPAAANPWGTASCHPAYDPCVPPTSETGDLNCPDIRAHYPGGVRVDLTHGDPHRLDRDKDGRGCE